MIRFAYVFPGQGSQSPGMGRELSEAYAESREVFEIADRSLEQPLTKLCFEGPAEELALTENTQPALLAASLAALRPLAARGLRPVAAAGHSLGEYSAHVAAGSLDLADALRAVRLRGRYMQEAVPVGLGAMAAILGLDAATVEQICERAAGEQVVSPANLNAPRQVVIAGHAEAVARAAAAAREAGARRVVPLPVSAPFHCSLMRPAAERLAPVLEQLAFKDPAYPILTNVDALPVEQAGPARDALLRQVASPVRWDELVRRIIGMGIEVFVEVGPGAVLAGLLRRMQRGLRVLSVADPGGVEAAVAELRA